MVGTECKRLNPVTEKKIASRIEDSIKCIVLKGFMGIKRIQALLLEYVIAICFRWVCVNVAFA